MPAPAVAACSATQDHFADDQVTALASRRSTGGTRNPDPGGGEATAVAGTASDTSATLA